MAIAGDNVFSAIGNPATTVQIPIAMERGLFGLAIRLLRRMWFQAGRDRSGMGDYEVAYMEFR
jgi:hypothetical protein